MTLQLQFDTAFEHLQQGRADEAIRLYMDILKAHENQPDALYMLGAIAFKMGNMDAAVHFSENVTRHASSYARGWLLKALVLRSQRHMDKSLAAALQALQLDTSLEEAWECAAMVLMHEGRWPEAHKHLEKALFHIPGNATLHGYLALTLAEEGDLPHAWQESRTTLAMDAQNNPAFLAKVTTLSKAGYYDRALETCRAAASNNEQLRRAVAFGEAEASLITGAFTAGYKLLAADEILHSPTADVPDWEGDYNPDHRLILYGDQGYGDMLQLMRFTDEVSQKTPRLCVRVPKPLERLYRTSFPKLELSVYAPLTNASRRGDGVDPVFEFPESISARCSFMRLPHVLGIGKHTAAEKIPYLRSDKGLVKVWRERLQEIPRPRIGLVWAGNPKHTNDHNRSIDFETLKPFIEKFRPHLVSLQTGARSAEAEQGNIFNAAPVMDDFAESAACLEELDVLISVDTAPVHLAGGMGRPVWVLLPFDPDWRWLIAREDSPWYPSARLFRQPQPGDWAAVIRTLITKTNKLVAGDASILRAPAWQGENLTRHPNPVVLEDIEN